MRAVALTTLLLCACGGAGTADTTASIRSQGANAAHDHYSGGAALGDWQGEGAQMGKLTAVSTNLDQALSIVLAGPTPAAGATYSLAAGGSLIKYGDSSKATRVWSSVEGTVTVDAITASTSDRSKTLHVSFANVSAQPATDAVANTATGELALQGSASIEGVYLPSP